MKDTERRIFVAKEYARRHTLTDEQRQKMIAEKLERGIQLALLYRRPESQNQTR